MVKTQKTVDFFYLKCTAYFGLRLIFFMLSSTIQQLRNAQITLTRSYFDLEVTRAIVHSDLKEMLFVELAHFCFVSYKQLKKAFKSAKMTTC